MSDQGAERKQVPLMEGLFTWPSDSPRLIGGRCNSCGTHFFPKSFVRHKPGCKERQIEEVLLSRRGRLDSYTVQHYPPPPPFLNPDPFVPYAIGWVALPEGIAVAGILTGGALEDLRMNMDVELVVKALGVDERGNEALTWMWRPL